MEKGKSVDIHRKRKGTRRQRNYIENGISGNGLSHGHSAGFGGFRGSRALSVPLRRCAEGQQMCVDWRVGCRVCGAGLACRADVGAGVGV